MKWFSCGFFLVVFGLILIARGVDVGVGIAATATTVGGVIITFAGAAMIAIGVVYVIGEIAKAPPVLR